MGVSLKDFLSLLHILVRDKHVVDVSFYIQDNKTSIKHFRNIDEMYDFCIANQNYGVHVVLDRIKPKEPAIINLNTVLGFRLNKKSVTILLNKPNELGKSTELIRF